MTRKQALLKCFKLWSYIAEVNRQGLIIYKWEAYIDLGLKADKAYCPCCQYNIHFGGGDCTKCPLREFWPLKCLHETSIFRQWEKESSHDEAALYAQTIADAAYYEAHLEE